MKKWKVLVGTLFLICSGVGYGAASNLWTITHRADAKLTTVGIGAIVLGLIGLGFLVSYEHAANKLRKMLETQSQRSYGEQ